MKRVKLPSMIKVRNSLWSVALLTALFSGTLSAKALNASTYTRTSALSSGKWVKIKTSGEGIHEINYDKLREWGFEPEKVNVYGYGGTLLAADVFSASTPDDVIPTYTHHENDKLYFYATGDVTPGLIDKDNVSKSRNHYSSDVYYLLSDRELDKSEMASAVPFKESETALNAHLTMTYVEEELQNPVFGGGIFLGKEINPNEQFEIPVTIEDFNTGNTNYAELFQLYFEFASQYNRATAMTISLPSTLVTNAKTETRTSAPLNYDPYTEFKFGHTVLKYIRTIPDGEYVFKAGVYSTSTPVVPNFLAADYYWYSYPRLNNMRQHSQLSMFFPSVKEINNFQLSAEEGTRVINVNTIYNIFEHQLQFDEESAMYVGSFDRNYMTSSSPVCHLVAYNVNRPQLQVEYVGELANQNLHGIDTPDMVIITTSALYDMAEELADIHRKYDGMDVFVVEHSKLFNEFSSATPDAMGYRRFLKMLYDRDPSKLKYIIMYGEASWDNRAITNMKKDRLLVHEALIPEYASKTTQSYGSDSYFGMLSDDYNPSKIIETRQNVAVGRIPAVDGSQARNYNNKILKYLTSKPSTAAVNTTVMMSDDGDSNQHFNQTEELAGILATGRPAMTIVRAHNSLYQWESGDAKLLRRITTEAMKRGIGLYTYVGHGNSNYFGSEHLWDRSTIYNTDYDNIPFGVVASCTIFGFDRTTENIGTSFLFKETGGLTAFIAAGRTVYASLNQTLAKEIISCYANAKPGSTFGDVWLNARNGLLSAPSDVYGTDNKVNTMCFNLAGDPALPVWVPEYKVNIKTIGDKSIEGLKTNLALEPLTPIAIQGTIDDADGKVAEDFNGTLLVQLYDSKYSASVLKRKSDDVSASVTLDQDLIANIEIKVKDGQFSGTLVSPLPVRESSTNRMSFHADSDDGRRADGVFTQFTMRAPKGAVAPLEGPAPNIDLMAVKQVTATSAMFTAEGSVDIIGLNTSSGLGSASSLVLDGKRDITGAKETIKIDNETNHWTLSIPLTELSTGNHVATLTITDNAGRHTVQSLQFTFNDSQTIVLTSDKSTVRDEVTFDVEHDMTDIVSSRFVIEDRLGNAVVNVENPTFPYVVDLSIPRGEEIDCLTDGFYSAYVMMQSSTTTGSSARLPLVLIKKAADEGDEETTPGSPEDNPETTQP